MIDRDKIWTFLMSEISNPYGVAGLMGNIEAESAYNPINLQDAFENRLSFTDRTYTDAVDSGIYSKNQFASDGAGYGLAQWTYPARKANLYHYCKTCNTSIGALFSQLGFMVDELQEMGLIDKLKSAKSVKEASDLILTKYEMPADQSESVKDYRARKGLNVYKYYVSDKNNLVRNYLNEAQALITKALDILK